MSDTSEEFLWAVKNGDLEVVQKICGGGKVDVNGDLASGRRPIHFAADYGHDEVIQYLVSKGAEVNVPDKHGLTPLLAAIYEDHLSCVECLLKNGADKTQKAPNGSSYIDCAESDEIKALLK